MSLPVAVNDADVPAIVSILTSTPAEFDNLNDVKQFMILMYALNEGLTADGIFLSAFPLNTGSKLYAFLARREKYGYFCLNGSAMFNFSGVAAAVNVGTTVVQDEGIDAAIIAAGKDNDTILNEIIAQGIDLNGSNENGTTPLMSAVQNDAATCMATIIGESVDVDAQDNLGKTALFHAVDRGNNTSVQTLLAAGATIEIEDHSARTPFVVAIQENKNTIVNTLITNSANPDYTDSTDAKSPSIHAAKANNAYALRRLGNFTANFDHQDNFGNTALMYTAIQNRITSALFLLNKGVNKALINNNGLTAAQLALNSGRLGKLSKIIEDF